MENTPHKIVLSLLITFMIAGCVAHYATTTEKNQASKNSESEERGENLAYNICGQCHYNEETKRFSGKHQEDLPRIIGKIYSANLTRSASHGILAKYSDGELAYLLKTGISREGKYIPYMVRPNLSEEDINDITVYFRSNDKAVAAVDAIAGKTRLNIIGKTGTKIAGKPLPYKKGVVRPDEKDAVVYGRYLVDNLACYHCHSKSITGLDYMEPEKSKGYMQGGLKFKTQKGTKVRGSNLTPCVKTGIGNYTKESFRKALMKGIDLVGDSLQYPMQKFPHLTNKQSDAIFAYLRTLEKVNHDTKK